MAKDINKLKTKILLAFTSKDKTKEVLRYVLKKDNYLYATDGYRAVRFENFLGETPDGLYCQSPTNWLVLAGVSLQYPDVSRLINTGSRYKDEFILETMLSLYMLNVRLNMTLNKNILIDWELLKPILSLEPKIRISKSSLSADDFAPLQLTEDKLGMLILINPIRLSSVALDKLN